MRLERVQAVEGFSFISLRWRNVFFRCHQQSEPTSEGVFLPPSERINVGTKNAFSLIVAAIFFCLKESSTESARIILFLSKKTVNALQNNEMTEKRQIKMANENLGCMRSKNFFFYYLAVETGRNNTIILTQDRQHFCLPGTTFFLILSRNKKNCFFSFGSNKKTRSICSLLSTFFNVMIRKENINGTRRTNTKNPLRFVV